MRHFSRFLAALAIAAAIAGPAAAQGIRIDGADGGYSSEVLRIGQDYTLRAGESIRQAVIIAGDATIEGRVDRDMVVVFGKTQLASTAVIDGSLIVVGGGVSIMPGATIGLDLVAVAGGYDAPVGFSPRGQHIVIGPAILGGQLDGVLPWITRGLLWGRLIVPGLPWIWTIVATFFIGYLILNLVFHRSVGACAETLTRRPITSFLSGLLVLLLTGPLCLLLVVSLLGIPVIPFVICSLIAASIIGKVSVARWIGMRITGQDSQESRAQGARSFAIGFGVLCLALMTPVLGIVAWTLTGGLGIGAAVLTFVNSYRRESPPQSRLKADRASGPAFAGQPGSEPTPGPDFAEQPVSEGTWSPASAGPPPAVSAIAVDPTAAVIPSVPRDLASFPRAPFRDRLAAFVLDVILVVIVQQLLDLTRRDSTFFLLLLGYHIGSWAWKSTTVGGIICQLRVVRVDGTAMQFPDALVRGLSGIFSLMLFGIGCFWILKDPERQAWHDKIAGTYVVTVPRNFPL